MANFKPKQDEKRNMYTISHVAVDKRGSKIVVKALVA
jgi:hypothetical protein